MVFQPRHLSLKGTQALPKKMAFLVTGPESSGTKMFVYSLGSVGVEWVHKNKHKTDNLDFNGFQDKIVLHRSCPHSNRLPEYRNIIRSMEAAGYTVFVIVMVREPDYNAKSQAKNHHVDNERNAHCNIAQAFVHMMNSIPSKFYAVRYEAFAGFRDHRKAVFDYFGFPPPTLEYYDANKQYEENDAE